jgi:alkaline phosphatase
VPPGKFTGLVTTAQVTDASPAAFGAHVPDRAQQSEIARHYLESSKPDVILGGGEDRWLPPGEEGAYEDNPATLLVVAGDRETGGLAIENIDEEDESGDGVSAEDGPFGIAGSDLEFTVDWSTGAHTSRARR